jgi:hypothetical protein
MWDYMFFIMFLENKVENPPSPLAFNYFVVVDVVVVVVV